MFYTTHISISIIFTIIAIFSIVRFYFGWIKEYKFIRADKYLAISFVVLLYVQLLMGVYLFYDKLSSIIVVKDNSIEDRFWPVEHFFIMFFSILIANLGYIYSKNIKSNSHKFRILSIYLSISFVLVLVSLAMIML